MFLVLSNRTKREKARIQTIEWERNEQLSRTIDLSIVS